MTDRHQELVTKLAEMRKLVDEATLGPWHYLESRDTWTLHGEARAFKGKVKYAPTMQILKAPKRGTPYAEYWPNAADSQLIVNSVNLLPFWLDWAEDVAARHFPVLCTCEVVHLLCAAHRAYSWEECPEIVGLLRAVDQLHIGQLLDSTSEEPQGSTGTGAQPVV